MKSLPTPSETLSLLILLALPASSLACGDGQSTIVPLPTFGGALTRLNGLSSGGQLTGSSQTSGNATHAFLYTAGTMIDLNGPGGDYSQGISVNSSGQVAGDMATAVFETHAFRYDGSLLADLGTLGGSFSLAIGINEAGQVTGNSLLPDSFSFVAFLYDGGTLTSLGTLGGSSSFANAMNQAGHVVGASSTDFDLESHAFLNTNGVMLDLGTLGGFYSTAYAVNDQDMVVGESELENLDTHAFAFANGVMTDLGTLGGVYSSASGVNAVGQIIGVATTAGDEATHGFIYQSGVMTDLGTLGGDYSEPLALDNLGRVVGVAKLTNDTVHAFLWQNGVLVDLNTLLPANSGWELTSADFLNDSGRIAGYGWLNGVERAFVMDLGSGNNPPTADAGSDQNLECPAQATLSASSSSDPDGDALTYQWSENGSVLGNSVTLTASFHLGVHVITLKVTDPCGQSSQDTVTVMVVDTTAPIITCPAAFNLSVVANCQGVLTDLSTQAVVTDGCTPGAALAIVQIPAPGSNLGLGQHAVTLTVTDASGNNSSCTVNVTVVDSTAPTILGELGPVTVAPVANCQALVPDFSSLVNATDNCTPVNALLITQSPVAASLVGAGQHTVTVTVTDNSGNSASTTVTLNVVDSVAPVITSSPVTVTVSAGPNCHGVVPNIVSSVIASDNCTAANQLVVGQNPVAGTVLSKGSHTITVTVADAAGNTAPTNVVLVIADVTAPDITSITASPNVLSPPNKQSVPVTVSVLASDACDPLPVSHITSVTCNEPPAPGDIQITGNLTVNLVATKNSAGTTRVYSINVRCTDASGNSSTGTVTVSVPKSNGNGGGGKKP